VSGQNIDWMLKRHCSVTPAQLGWAYGLLCVVSLGIGAAFWLSGAPFVLGFAWIELIAVGLAFLAYARHASDGELISLRGSRLVIETELAGRRERAEFNRDWHAVNDLPGGPAVNQLNLHPPVTKIAEEQALAALVHADPVHDHLHRGVRRDVLFHLEAPQVGRPQGGQLP
jgi:hypothetical protein